MGLLDKLFVGGVVALIGGGVVQIHRAAKETRARRASPLTFDDRLTQLDFAEMVDRVAKKTPRIASVETTGLDVFLKVRSNSGLSVWTAQFDFNDYGRATGRYWMTTENKQSPIPEYFAEALQAEIQQRTG